MISHSGLAQTTLQFLGDTLPSAPHSWPTMLGISIKLVTEAASHVGAMAGSSLLSQEQVTGLHVVVQVGVLMKQPNTLPHGPSPRTLLHLAAHFASPHVASHVGHASLAQTLLAQFKLHDGGSQIGKHWTCGGGNVHVTACFALPQLHTGGAHL